MTKTQTARWNRHLKLRQVRQHYADTPTGALVARKFSRYDELLAAVDALMATPAGRSAGATRKKSQEEKTLVVRVMPFANALYLLYGEAGDDEKAHALRRNKSDYSSLPGALLLAEARNVATQAQASAKALAEDAKLDQADLAALNQAVAAFAQLLAAPKVAVEAGKNANTALAAALKAADAFVKTDLTPAVETLKQKQPAFYAALTQAMRIDDAPGGRGPGPTPGPGKPAA